MARAHQRRSGFVASKRLSQWIGPADQNFVGVPAGTKVIHQSFTPQTAVPSMIRPTVVRVRGQVAHNPSVFSADLDYSGAIGFCIVSLDAFAAGVASIPGPLTDSGWGGWFVWEGFSYHLEFSDATGFRPTVQIINMDSKAMRKIGVNEALVVVVESGDNLYEVSAQFRMLLKLS